METPFPHLLSPIRIGGVTFRNRLFAAPTGLQACQDGGIAPTEDTVKDGSYVIQRPFVLVTKDGVELSAAAQAFFDYATSADAADLIAAAGAVAVAK